MWSNQKRVLHQMAVNVLSNPITIQDSPHATNFTYYKQQHATDQFHPNSTSSKNSYNKITRKRKEKKRMEKTKKLALFSILQKLQPVDDFCFVLHNNSYIYREKNNTQLQFDLLQI
ncbi:hypothetical protein S245_070566 [Arachis hypogaea]